MAKDLSTAAVLQGAQVAVVGTDVDGRGGHPRRVVQVPLRRRSPRADRTSWDRRRHDGPGDPPRGSPGRPAAVTGADHELGADDHHDDRADRRRRRPGRAPAASSARAAGLGSYMLVRFLLIFPTVFILVTTGLLPDADHRRPDHRGAGRPAARRPAGRAHPRRPATTGRCSSSTSSTSASSSRGNFGTTITDSRPVTEVLTTFGAATLELAFNALIVALRRRHPARPARRHRRDKAPDAVAAGLRDPLLRHAGLLRRPAAQARLLRLAGLAAGRRPGLHRHGARSCRRWTNPTGIYLIDALRHRRPRRRSATCSQHAVLPAVALGLLTAGIFLRLVRTNVIGTLGTDYVEAGRSRGVSEFRLVTQARLQAGADPDHHRHRPADRAAARRRGADRDDLRVEGPGLPAGRSTCRPATSSPCRASSCCWPSSSRVTNFIVDIIAALIDPRVRY